MSEPAAVRQWWWVGDDPPGGVPEHLLEDDDRIRKYNPALDGPMDRDRIVRVTITAYDRSRPDDAPAYFTAYLFQVEQAGLSGYHYWVKTTISTKPTRDLRLAQDEGIQLARKHRAQWVGGLGSIHLRQAVLMPADTEGMICL